MTSLRISLKSASVGGASHDDTTADFLAVLGKDTFAVQSFGQSSFFCLVNERRVSRALTKVSTHGSTP